MASTSKKRYIITNIWAKLICKKINMRKQASIAYKTCTGAVSGAHSDAYTINLNVSTSQTFRQVHRPGRNISVLIERCLVRGIYYINNENGFLY